MSTLIIETHARVQRRRLIDPGHASRIDQVEHAQAVLGVDLVVEDAAYV